MLPLHYSRNLIRKPLQLNRTYSVRVYMEPVAAFADEVARFGGSLWKPSPDFSGTFYATPYSLQGHPCVSVLGADRLYSDGCTKKRTELVKAIWDITTFTNGAECQTWTGDLRITSALLYQLS